MRLRERIEIGLIAFAIPVFAYFSDRMPTKIELGQLFVFSALTLLLQGLVRDLHILYQHKRSAANAPQRKMRCMCVESTLGLGVICLGIVFSLFFQDWSVELSALAWVLLWGSVLVFGFLAKDWIITWRPFSLRKEKDHENIIFRF